MTHIIIIFYYDDYGDLVFSRKDVSSGVHHYFDSDGNLMLVVNAKGNSGLGDMSSKYRRYYFFENGEMIFALCEGTPNHRLYFYKGRLMRWTSNDIAEDYTYSDEFLMWEQLVTDELAYLGFQ